MVVSFIVYMVLCVVVFSLQSNCFVTVLHVVSHCCPGYCNVFSVSVPVVFASVGAIFCESGHGLGLYCLSCFSFTNVIVGDASVDLISKC